NKMDREGRDPFDLLDEIEKTLALSTVPMTWPMGRGRDFAGTYDFTARHVRLVDRDDAPLPMAADDVAGIGRIAPRIDAAATAEELSLVQEACGEFDLQAFREGHQTPVFFGSAIKNFGVGDLLKGLGDHAPAPRDQAAATRVVHATEDKLSAFVFKIQANMDPNHRDRIAFFRLVSGKFQRGMRLKTIAGKQIGITAPVMFMAQDREIADEAFGGDVIGIPNHGALRVGDGLSESGNVQFAGIPNFAPEILRRVRTKDPMKAKHLRKALEGMAEEGVTQLFTPELGSDMIVGAVGQLQIEVMAERIVTENNLEVLFEPAPYNVARWIACDDKGKLEAFLDKNKASVGKDLDGAPVFLAKNAWDVGYVQERNPDIRFTKTKERV
ncbi:MAG: peptide chain release factor 3, partial [Bradyrhizobium sp.]